MADINPTSFKAHPNRFVASTTVLLSAKQLHNLQTHHWLAVKSGTIIVGVCNPAQRTSIYLHMIPSVPLTDDQTVERRITQLKNTALISPVAIGSIQDTVKNLRSRIKPVPVSNFDAQSGELDFENTLRTRLSEGALFVALYVYAEEDGLVRALTNLPSGYWIAPISCYVKYKRRRSEYGQHGRWELDPIISSAELATAGVDTMVDRGKLSQERGTEFAEWLEELAHKIKPIPRIKLIDR